MLWNPRNTANAAILREAEVPARALGVHLVPLGVRSPDELEGAFRDALKGRVEALLAFGDTLLLTHRARSVEFAAWNRLPATYANQDYIDVGGLKTAKALGLTIPQALLLRADQVIQ